VAQWYHRNLLIATNITRLSQGPGERILVLIGAGHAKLLREFLSEVPGFEVVDCLRYLK
jgi:pheromone shutdown protein TraB